jgi:hypothetical protein
MSAAGAPTYLNRLRIADSRRSAIETFRSLLSTYLSRSRDPAYQTGPPLFGNAAEFNDADAQFRAAEAALGNFFWANPDVAKIIAQDTGIDPRVKAMADRKYKVKSLIPKSFYPSPPVAPNASSIETIEMQQGGPNALTRARIAAVGNTTRQKYAETLTRSIMGAKRGGARCRRTRRHRSRRSKRGTRRH